MEKIKDFIGEKNKPLIIADHEGIVTSINESFQNTYGWKVEDLVGKPISVIIPEELRDAHHLGFSRYLLTSKHNVLGMPIDLKIVMASGEVTTAKHHIIADEIDGKKVFAARICLEN